MRPAPGNPPSARRRFWIDQAIAGLDRIDGFVEFVAVEAEPGLEPERIARAEPDRRNVRLGQQQAREAFGLRRAERNLVAVLAGVAGAGDERLDAADPRRPRRHEGHRVEALGGREPRQRRRGERPLQRDQRRVVERRETDAAGQALGEQRIIDGLARGVDDEPQRAVGARRAGDHEVVDDRRPLR